MSRMHMIAPHIIDQARAVRIEQECERRGIALWGAIDRCGPWCGGTDRFAINIRKQVFLCRRCGVAGDVIRLVQHVDACSFAEAVKVLTGDHVLLQAAPRASKKRKQSAEEYAQASSPFLPSGRRPRGARPTITRRPQRRKTVGVRHES
jgi:hypothetical protein